MSLPGRRAATPRLAPELDDTELGKVRKRLTERGASTSRALGIALMERLLKGTDQDWDRRAHQLSVLAESALPSLPHSWAERQPDSPDALTLLAWGVTRRGQRQRTVRPQPKKPFSQRCEPLHSAPAFPAHELATPTVIGPTEATRLGTTS